MVLKELTSRYEILFLIIFTAISKATTNTAVKAPYTRIPVYHGADCIA